MGSKKVRDAVFITHVFETRANLSACTDLGFQRSAIRRFLHTEVDGSCHVEGGILSSVRTALEQAQLNMKMKLCEVFLEKFHIAAPSMSFFCYCLFINCTNKP